jgi:hypothetical protein
MANDTNNPIVESNVPEDELATVIRDYHRNDPPPLSVTSVRDGKGTFTVTVWFAPDGPNAPDQPTPDELYGQEPQKPSPLGGGGLPANGSKKGFDASEDCSHVLTKAKTAGINFIIRYYSHSASKNLTPSEARLISSSAMSIVAVWETAGDRYGFFSQSQGQADGAAASTMAQKIGQPNDSTIYFAVDFDATVAQVAANITDYFKGVRSGLAAAMPGKPTYSVGVYGSGRVCSTLLQNRLVDQTWMANTWLKSSNNFTAWNIKQSPEGDPWGFGFNVDPDSAGGEFGAFTVGLGGAIV